MEEERWMVKCRRKKKTWGKNSQRNEHGKRQKKVVVQNNNELENKEVRGKLLRERTLNLKNENKRWE